MTDLFSLTVPEDQANDLFLRLRSEDVYASTRRLMNRLFAVLPNPDGNFIREFQTAGFDSRVWELYLFALREDDIWAVDRPHESPDYLFSRFGERAWVEAVIAGPAQKLREPEERERFQEFIDNGLAIRYGTPLGNKLERRYCELSHVAGKALIVAIADFVERDVVRWSEEGLLRYLYGANIVMTSEPGEPVEGITTTVESHQYGVKTIPSGFFNFPGAEQVSAVLFSNSGTVAKFHRQAFDASVDRSYRLVRHGFCPDPRATSPLPQPFAYIVGEVEEPWSEGLVAMHNPNAMHPLSRGFFQGVTQWWLRDGELDVSAPSFHPFSSVTTICHRETGEVDEKFEERLNRFAEYLIDRTQMTDADIAKTYERHRAMRQKQ